ncbi:acetyl-CoA carboxylase biotin carboxylase subunit family protein [Streptantibioticus rubrisoli]|uniref:ATP-grasp domain-containing protein n=1 Tax=Streptantibioticus rubrisoli TaxID=1387313 RepID=A0ABT1P8Z3_9ACTN|nr:ATP-grasp domain-containing protein [Streptantibioticus rubrisoli]MCQ4041844.1 ATP-grasp domain-containing protein [Streptantibioticus rubrisoli]
MANGARLLVLGAGNQRERSFHRWAADGLRVTLVDGFSHSRYDHVVERAVPWDVRDSAVPDLDALAALAAEHQGVTTLSDDCQITTALVAERLGWPSAGVPAARLARDKSRQRLVAAEHGLPTVAHHAAGDPRAVAEFVEGRGGPCVVKPVGAGGSASVAKVVGGEQALVACEVMLQRGHRLFLAEDFLIGPEISYEGVVRAGRLVRASVTEKEVVSDGCFLERQHLVTAPGPLDEPEAHRGVHALAGGLVRAFGVADAVIHLEAKLTGQGPVPVEMAVRPAGDCIPELVERTHGRDLYGHLAALALGRPAPPDLPTDADASVAGVRFCVGRGRVTGYARPADVLRGLETVRIAVQSGQVGRWYGEPAGNWDRVGYVLGWGADRSIVEKELAIACDRQLSLAGLSDG